MKELTFKEVISNIKEGETWENQDLVVYLAGDELNIDWKDGKPDKGIGFNIDDVFVLQRNKVSFSEAFKAYEEGKEIESCVTGYKYRKKCEKDYYKGLYDCTWVAWSDGDGAIDLDEIRGEWYIN